MNSLSESIPHREYDEIAKEIAPEQFQAEWERLICVAQDSRKEEFKALGTIKLPDGNKFQENLFVRAGHSAPDVGAVLIGENSTLRYMCHCFEGYPQPYGKILLAEPQMEAFSGGRGFSLPPEAAGSYAMALSTRYDDFIVQAVANVTGNRVVHSVVIGRRERSKETFYLQKGYTRRPGYSQYIDKVFEPQPCMNRPVRCFMKYLEFAHKQL
jgi:hypothetical protein